MNAMNDFLNDPRVASEITPEIRVYLETNMPFEGTSLDHQVGHWIGVTVAALQLLDKAHERIRELEVRN